MKRRLLLLVVFLTSVFSAGCAPQQSYYFGNYSQTLRLLRGGLISESKIRLSAYALLDLLPEDNDDEIVYKCNESFRIFLRYFDILDKEVELASRPSFPLGGVGEGDVRIELLTKVGEVEDALKIFVNNIKVGLGE